MGDIQHVIDYLRDFEGAESEARAVEAMRYEIERLRDVAVKYHEWLERVDEIRLAGGSFIGLDHHIGENVEGCSGCAVLAANSVGNPGDVGNSP